MKANYLEVGKILNTHGVRGELKVQPWLDSPLLFQQLSELSVNGRTYAIHSVRFQGANALVTLEGISSMRCPSKGRWPLPGGRIFRWKKGGTLWPISSG